MSRKRYALGNSRRTDQHGKAVWAKCGRTLRAVEQTMVVALVKLWYWLGWSVAPEVVWTIEKLNDVEWPGASWNLDAL